MINKKEKPIILKIKKIKSEAFNTKTFVFDYQLKALPGQFLMLWIPGVDQKPISISRQTNNNFELTVSKIGKATTELFKMKVGDSIGISGPYGNSFSIKSKAKVILVGGGCGSAPLRFLADTAKKAKCNITFITGARSAKNVLFKKEFPGTCIVTDDGSAGFKGFTTQKLEELLKKEKYHKVYACGPEIMMKKVAEMCERYHVPCEISMERYMKCGFGVCGQCAVDPLGICICQDGPIFSGVEAKKITEFGKYHRDKSGLKKYFK